MALTRLPYNRRPKYFNQFTALAGPGNLPQFTEQSGMLDASLNHAVTKKSSIDLQAQSITNTLRQTYREIPLGSPATNWYLIEIVR